MHHMTVTILNLENAQMGEQGTLTFLRGICKDNITNIFHSLIMVYMSRVNHIFVAVYNL